MVKTKPKRTSCDIRHLITGFSFWAHVFALALLLPLFHASRTDVYSIAYGTGSQSWCDSSLRAALNNGTLAALHGEDYATYIKNADDGCGNAYFTILTQSEWDTTTGGAGKDAYKAGLNTDSSHTSTSYLPNDVSAVWLRDNTAAGTQAYKTDTTGTTSTATQTDSYDALPVIQLNDDICISNADAAGTYDDPYDLTNQDCPVGPSTLTVTTLGTTSILTANSDLTLTGTVYDANSSTSAGGKKVLVTVTLASGVSQSVEVATGSLQNWSVTFPYASVPQGTYTGFSITATDQTGYTTDKTITYTDTIIVDKTAPYCGTTSSAAAVWNPTAATWKSTAGGTLFQLTSATDTGGSALNKWCLNSDGATNCTTFATSATPQCTTGTANNDTCSIYLVDAAGNISSACTSPVNKVDTVTPSVACTISDVSGNSYLKDTKTVYVKTNGSGSFKLNATVTVGASGVKTNGVTFPTIGNSSWTPSSGPSFSTTGPSQVYSWVSGATTSASTGTSTISPSSTY